MELLEVKPGKQLKQSESIAQLWKVSKSNIGIQSMVNPEHNDGSKSDLNPFVHGPYSVKNKRGMTLKVKKTFEHAFQDHGENVSRFDQS